VAVKRRQILNGVISVYACVFASGCFVAHDQIAPWPKLINAYYMLHIKLTRIKVIIRQ
jgi:hypothetical protein